MKVYHEGLEKWEVANNITAGVILGSLSAEVMHLVNPDEPAKDMYNRLKATIIQHTSGSSVYGTQIELVQKQFMDTPTLDNFEKHLTFFRLKNADLIATSSGLDDSFLMFLLLYSFNSNTNPIWSITSTNIATSGMPTRQWSFKQVAGKLHEALRNGIRSLDSSTSSGPSPNQMALNTTTTKTAQSRYSRPACKYPKCRHPKSHVTEDCWTKEKDKHERDKAKKAKEKKYKAKRAERKVTSDSSSSNSESASDSGSESEPCRKSRHQAHRLKAKLTKTLRLLKATSHHVSPSHEKPAQTLFVAHLDSGALNHMTCDKSLFDPASFRMLLKPIPVSLGDNSKILATGKGTLQLLFNVDGKKKEGRFEDVLFIPKLKVTLLSIGQLACLPHCKVVFDNNVCKYINKNTNEIIAQVFTAESGDLYTLNATLMKQKVVANLTSSSSTLIPSTGGLGTLELTTVISWSIMVWWMGWIEL